MKKSLAMCLAVLLFLQTFSLGATAANLNKTADYTGAVLAAVNTNYDDWTQMFSAYCPEQTQAATQSEGMHRIHAVDAPEQELLCGTEDTLPEPLSPAQALQKQAQQKKNEPQAVAADYRVGDKKTVFSTGRKKNASSWVKVECVYVGKNCTVWNEVDGDYSQEESVQLGISFDELIPRELALFGDKRIDTDGDGKIAVFVYGDMDDGMGGFFTGIDLVDRFGRIGNVWFSLISGNACDCVHLSWASLSSAVHEYQHYIQFCWKFVGKNNFSFISNPNETFLNEGFSECAQYLLLDDNEVDEFYYATIRTDKYSLVNWFFDSSAYALDYVFCQYLRTRYAQLTDTEDGIHPGAEIYKTILDIRANKKVENTLSIVANLLYPTADYPDLKSEDSRIRQLLVDFWLAVLCKEKEGIHGFNGEAWAESVTADIQLDLPETGSKGIRSGMAAFYYINTSGGFKRGTACVTDAGKDMVFVSVDGIGYEVIYDWNDGSGESEAYLRFSETEYIPSFFEGACPGKALRGWSTDPNATAPMYTDGEEILLSPDEETVLYAVWEDALPITLCETVTFTEKGEHCIRFVPAQSGYYCLMGEDGVGASIYTNQEMIYPEWSDVGDECGWLWENGYYLQSGEPYDIYVLCVMGYAVRLDPILTQYGLQYDANLDEENWPIFRQNGRTAYPLLDMDWDVSMYAMTRGLEFAGWALHPDDTATIMRPDDVLSLETDTTLYAVWKPITVLSEDNTVTADSSEQSIQKFFTVTPKSDGTYRLSTSFTAEESSDVNFWGTFYIYDAEEKMLHDDHIYETNLEFDLSLRAGKTYYFSCSLFNDGTQDFTANISLQKVSDASSARLLLDTNETKIPLGYIAFSDRFVYKIPKLDPISEDGGTFAGWKNNLTGEILHAGDTIEPIADQVLYPVWEYPQETTQSQPKLFSLLLSVIRYRWQAFILSLRRNVENVTSI